MIWGLGLNIMRWAKLTMTDRNGSINLRLTDNSIDFVKSEK